MIISKYVPYNELDEAKLEQLTSDLGLSLEDLKSIQPELDPIKSEFGEITGYKIRFNKDATQEVLDSIIFLDREDNSVSILNIETIGSPWINLTQAQAMALVKQVKKED